MSNPLRRLADDLLNADGGAVHPLARLRWIAPPARSDGDEPAQPPLRAAQRPGIRDVSRAEPPPEAAEDPIRQPPPQGEAARRVGEEPATPQPLAAKVTPASAIAPARASTPAPSRAIPPRAEPESADGQSAARPRHGAPAKPEPATADQRRPDGKRNAREPNPHRRTLAAEPLSRQNPDLRPPRPLFGPDETRRPELSSSLASPSLAPPPRIIASLATATPRPAVAQRATDSPRGKPQAEGEAREVHVHIGRIEVTAQSAAAAPARPRPPTMSLDDYLGLKPGAGR